MNTEDDIEVFSKENLPFYNRVLLPNYISGSLPWDNLVKITDREEYEYNIKLYRGVSIEHINRETKTVTDSNGNIHMYDVLIIATGSRAAMIKDAPRMSGIFAMRNRSMQTTSKHMLILPKETC